MKTLILLFIVLISTINIYAKTIEAKYKISYGEFLNLGIANSILNTTDDNYYIKIEVQTTGPAKYLSNNRIEVYESFGKVINHQFVPNKFIKTKKDKYKQRVRTYIFDYKNNKILLNDKRTGKKKKRNIVFEEKFEVIDSERNSILEYFAKDDILSLFFNMHIKMLGYEGGKEYTLKAVGANKTKGIINILMPSNNDLKKLNEALRTNDKSKFTAYVNQKIFQSKRGELLISLNDYGFCSKAVLKDVLLFGDIVGEMIEFKIDKG